MLPHGVLLCNATCDFRLLPAMLLRLYAWSLPTAAVAALSLPRRGPQGLRSMPAPLLTAPLLPGAAAAGQLLARVLSWQLRGASRDTRQQACLLPLMADKKLSASQLPGAMPCCSPHWSMLYEPRPGVVVPCMWQVGVQVAERKRETEGV